MSPILSSAQFLIVQFPQNRTKCNYRGTQDRGILDSRATSILHRYRWNWTRWGRTTHSIQHWSMVSPNIRTQVVPYACFQHRKLSSTREMDTIKNCNIHEMNIGRIISFSLLNQRIILKLLNLCHAVSNLQIEKVVAVDYTAFSSNLPHTHRNPRRNHLTHVNAHDNTQRGGIVLHPPQDPNKENEI